MSGISDELRDKIRLAISDPSHFLKRGDESVPAWATRAVVSLLDESGVAVVDLPEPNRAEPTEDATLWKVENLDVEAWRGEVSLMWGTDGDGGDGQSLTAVRARTLAGALLAAADEHERRARVADGGAR